jgi:hypothetical protein
VADARIASTIARDSEVTQATNDVVSNLAAGAYSLAGNGAGITNLNLFQVKYFTQTRPSGANSNFFGPWTPGTTTAGIQEAWDSVSRGTNYGAYGCATEFRFEPGYYFFTNQIVISNRFNTDIKWTGGGMLGTKLVYAGNQSGISTILFKGGPANTNAGATDLPMHVVVSDLGFSAINDTTNILVQVSDYSLADFSRCNFTSWDCTTNRASGAGMSVLAEAISAVTKASLVGLYLDGYWDHGVVLQDCYFFCLATGLDVRADHVLAQGLRFGFIGIKTNEWPATSRYSLGACVVKDIGNDTLWQGLHFYASKAGFVQIGNAADAAVLDRANFEAVTHFVGVLESNENGGVILRDPIELTSDAGWPSLSAVVVSNSPNYGFLATPATNFVVYGVDNRGSVNNTDFFYARRGATNIFTAHPAGINVVGNTATEKLSVGDVTQSEYGQFFKPVGNFIFNAAAEYYQGGLVVSVSPVNGILISDGTEQVVMYNNGTLEASTSVSSPKLIIGTPTITSGSGAPSADEPKGSLYLRTDGSTSTTLYVKTATGGGGWTAK